MALADLALPVRFPMSAPAATSSVVFDLVGMDPSLRNWAAVHLRWTFDPIAFMTDPEALGQLEIVAFDLIQPEAPKLKQVRRNSEDLDRARTLFQGVRQFVDRAAPRMVFVEVPSGSQSSRGMASYGICVGVLGALRSLGLPLLELQEREVKLVTGKRTATKVEMIRWAVERHPDAAWPRFQGELSAARCEHLADAVAAVHAGIAHAEFRKLLQLLRMPTAP